MDPLAFFIIFPIRLLMAYGIACLGRERTTGFGWAFFFGIISPVVGLIIVLCCKKRGTTFVDVTAQGQNQQK